MKKITESSSSYDNLEQMSALELVEKINVEDHQVAPAVQQKLQQISAFVDAIVPRMREGGRLFYIGAGTSGRLGILDASECPPTYGVPHDWVIGLIAGEIQLFEKRWSMLKMIWSRHGKTYRPTGFQLWIRW